MDTDNDGQLSREEFVAAMRKLKVDDVKANQAFDAMDHEGDGYISYSEFLAAMVTSDKISDVDFSKNANLAFRLIDRKNKGVISEEQFKASLLKAGVHLLPHNSKRRESAGKLFKQMDTDRDGLVTRKEFEKFLIGMKRE
eukprot:GHVR01056518.1.p1 GENE.GHVR01056518.1~~GHVR01056518.1.p1  ORF type:complete len:140 (+),score=43.41 GHVR01056518.1:143-562(+)